MTLVSTGAKNNQIPDEDADGYNQGKYEKGIEHGSHGTGMEIVKIVNRI